MNMKPALSRGRIVAGSGGLTYRAAPPSGAQSAHAQDLMATHLRRPPWAFLLTVCVVLGALHAYIGLRVLPPLPVSSGWKLAAAIWLALSVGLLPASMAAPFVGRQPWRDRLAWAGFLAMGLFSSLLVATLLRDVLLGGAWLAGSLTGQAWPSAALLEWTAAAVPLLAGAATLLGLFNARRRPALVEVAVPIAGLPAALHGLRIAQITDLHVGPTIKRGYVERVVAAANAAQPDLTVLTGDLVDGSVDELALHTAPLGGLRARHGVYAVTGNHEYYSNAHRWIAEYRRLGLTVLMNEHVVLRHEQGEAHAPLLLAGIPDYTAHHFDPTHRSDPKQALHGAPPEVAVKILLAHQPRSAEAAALAGFDLQLSGHTHGGQFFPWNLFVPLQQPYVSGLVKHMTLWVYVSRGTGYWGPPKRLGAPSEITLLRLVAG